MSFKDLHASNFALLAKQRWQLQQGKNSLFYRVFKNKYFHDEEFIHAKKGHHPSFAWRSIWVAQSLIRDGVKWQKYQHMEGQVDKYTIHLSYSLSPQRLLPMEATVNVLIDAENGE